MRKEYDTPIRTDAFDLSDEQKKMRIEEKFRDIMEILGLDLTDDSLAETPKRVAKMYVEEIFDGLNPKNEPTNSLFTNSYNYHNMLVEKDITLYSMCEHHFMPIIGKVHVAYISKGDVIGLSKINRIVQYLGRRPQVQERLTIQIVRKLQDLLQTQDVACIIEAKHLCVNARGVRDTQSATLTSEYGGVFAESETKRNEFRAYLNLNSI